MTLVDKSPARIAELEQEVRDLRRQIDQWTTRDVRGYLLSDAAQEDWFDLRRIPDAGLSAEAARVMVENAHSLDFDQRLNTSSYVNVALDDEEAAIVLMGMQVNLADQTVYPQSYKLHDTTVNMIADLWHCPKPDDFDEYGVFPGAGTVGSTEACLLAGLALKFRWRHWYARRKRTTVDRILGVRPNLVISTCFQAAWEKLFKYMDIEPRLLAPSVGSFALEPERVREAIDERTIGVVCIMGNHYGGQYDPVHEVDRVVEEVNRERGFRVGIHVDAASGGFVAPFQEGLPPWDFRLKNVLSISASGHKYGESCCGTGWVVWRERSDLSEHVGISVTYLGGKAHSYTLNFSRPASGVYDQYYKLIHFGREGYERVTKNMMENARFIRDGLKSMTCNGKPRFLLLDDGDEHCLPVVSAMLNPDCGLDHGATDLQHAVSQHHWYVGSYPMEYDHPVTGERLPLFHDADREQSMFRVVVKSNLTRNLAGHLLESVDHALETLDTVSASGTRSFEWHRLRHKDQRRFTDHC